MLSLQFSPFPVLESERFMYRAFKNEDIDTLFELRANPEVMKYIARPIAKTTDDVLPVVQMMKDNVLHNKGIPWFIEDKITNETVGQIGFHKIDVDNYRAEIGYYLLPQHNGKGIMTEAIYTVLNYAFTQTQINSIEAKVAPENVASSKVLLKNNFVLEGNFREDFFYEGKFLHTYVYVLLKSDWQKT